MPGKVIVIGSGFAGLTAACDLAYAGFEVTLLEKNAQAGGRARQFEADGFVFDMGPSWYWMPNVFESFFNRYGKSASDYYDLVQLDPAFQIIYPDGKTLSIPAALEEIHHVFEKIETGASKKLTAFLDESKRKYEVAMQEFIFLPSHHLMEFAKFSILREAFSMDLLKPFDKYVSKFFSDARLRTLMEFPVLFLGAKPNQIPAMYSMMNYSALAEGTWYPLGGMHKIIEGFVQLANELGVKLIIEAEVESVEVAAQEIKSVMAKGVKYQADYFLAACDYHHFETLLPKQKRNYKESYWDKRTMSPSSLLFYVGVDKKIPGLQHHNLFFDSDFSLHSHEIYDEPAWPSDPQFYVCCPSKTDTTVAPSGKENLFFLIPIAPGLEDTEEVRDRYFEQLISRTEAYTGVSFKDQIIYKKSYCINDFKKDYHAYKGNAYGLANTLRQTAVLKPKMRNRQLKNLWYTGQLTVPGPGMPPAIISGLIAGNEIKKQIPSLITA
jgi:phytoene desaturase